MKYLAKLIPVLLLVLAGSAHAFNLGDTTNNVPIAVSGAYAGAHADSYARARPWAENAVSFWRWFQSVTAQPKQ